MNPYHVDSLLQLSDVCRMQEDQEMARDLIGKSEVRSRCVGVKSFPGKGSGGQEPRSQNGSFCDLMWKCSLPWSLLPADCVKYLCVSLGWE